MSAPQDDPELARQPGSAPRLAVSAWFAAHRRSGRLRPRTSHRRPAAVGSPRSRTGNRRRTGGPAAGARAARACGAAEHGGGAVRDVSEQQPKAGPRLGRRWSAELFGDRSGCRRRTGPEVLSETLRGPASRYEVKAGADHLYGGADGVVRPPPRLFRSSVQACSLVRSRTSDGASRDPPMATFCVRPDGGNRASLGPR